MRRRTKLIVLECISETKEKVSESGFLWELMRILGFEEQTELRIIGGPNRLIEEIENAKEQYLHISAHGDFHKTKGTYLETPRKGKVYSSDLDDLWAEKKKIEIPRLVMLSVCQAGHVDMVRTFSDAGCRYCIAPLQDTSFEDAAGFLTIFYKLLIGEKKTPWIAFRNSIVGLSHSIPRLSGAWSFYEWGEKCLIDTE